eukprot:scaffold60663_cov75-Phaeocystis_antarctica.AAC.2
MWIPENKINHFGISDYTPYLATGAHSVTTRASSPPGPGATVTLWGSKVRAGAAHRARCRTAQVSLSRLALCRCNAQKAYHWLLANHWLSATPLNTQCRVVFSTAAELVIGAASNTRDYFRAVCRAADSHVIPPVGLRPAKHDEFGQEDAPVGPVDKLNAVNFFRPHMCASWHETLDICSPIVVRTEQSAVEGMRLRMHGS